MKQDADCPEIGVFDKFCLSTQMNSQDGGFKMDKTTAL